MTVSKETVVYVVVLAETANTVVTIRAYLSEVKAVAEVERLRKIYPHRTYMVEELNLDTDE